MIDDVTRNNAKKVSEMTGISEDDIIQLSTAFSTSKVHYKILNSGVAINSKMDTGFLYGLIVAFLFTQGKGSEIEESLNPEKK